MYSSFGFGAMSNILFTIVPLFILAIFVMIIFQIIKQASLNKKNDNSPRISVPALVVTKRSDVTYRHTDTGNDSMHTHSSTTWYYATFQVESGDRMELSLTGSEFGLLAEGDTGLLTFQGTRYLSFERK